MKTYIFAISVVVQNKSELNNKMTSGIGSIPTIENWIRNFEYDERSSNDIKLINFNIHDLQDCSKRYQINRSYQNGILKEYLAEIADELKKLDIGQEN